MARDIEMRIEIISEPLEEASSWKIPKKIIHKSNLVKWCNKEKREVNMTQDLLPQNESNSFVTSR